MKVLYSIILVLATICSNNAYDKLSPAFIVQRGSPIDLSYFPIGNNPTTFLLKYDDPNYEAIVSNISESRIPVVTGAPEKVIPYNLTQYFHELKTMSFGRNVIIADNIPTTMDIGHDFGVLNGLVIIANEQTKGRGSNHSKWESPRGDVYMNINLNIPNKNLAKLLPRICAMSLIQAAKDTLFEITESEFLPITFHAPISIYWEPSEIKIGGVLVEPITVNFPTDSYWYTAGCGLRVNSDIDNTLSKFIDKYYVNNTNIDLPTLIAKTVNYVELFSILFLNSPEIW